MLKCKLYNLISMDTIQTSHFTFYRKGLSIRSNHFLTDSKKIEFFAMITVS